MTSFPALRQYVQELIDAYVPSRDCYPSWIHEAMRYAALSRGHRWRPILAFMVAEAAGCDMQRIAKAAAAIELYHCASLPLDDLPCMDNADMRRGQQCAHIVFGEAVTVLASIALSRIADRLLGENCSELGANRARLDRELYDTLGTENGVIGGQVVDVATKGHDKADPTAADIVDYIHKGKAVALFRFAARAPAILLQADEEFIEVVSRFGDHLGRGYQIGDDILDEVGTEEALGKGIHMDSGKLTYVAVHGLSESRRAASRERKAALDALRPLGPRAQVLSDFVLELLGHPV